MKTPCVSVAWFAACMTELKGIARKSSIVIVAIAPVSLSRGVKRLGEKPESISKMIVNAFVYLHHDAERRKG
ncbi:MAG: hypothetical protein H7288_05275 [Kineosporiaceae bacterium]|nr:hypothetical protein [Aeromicrobium sp.]